ncbi:MAG: PIG-L family deacetylase [Chloroflexi bacterium]|nr:PIG-L family deacetylase [Chloroflexota bacterium]MBI2980333.1 PIG-L family deacetylase [Chloroflexota bacterium]
MTKPAQVMLVMAHPDDPEFGAAGTTARWVREGKDVVDVVCTNGNKGTSDINMKSEELAKIREQEQLAAAKVLGVREVIFLRHPDQGLEDTPEFRKEIVRLIRMYRPDIVLTHDPYRRYIGHRDHRITGQVTLDAIFPSARDLLAYPDLLEQGLQPHKVKEVWLTGSEEPDYCSDITDTFGLKIAAIRCHKSQIGDHSNPTLEERMRERCRTAAQGESFELAEAFHRVEILR